MDQATTTLWLSIVGTSVAIVLAAIRGYEFFRAKRSLLGKNFKLGRRFLRTEFSLEDVVCDITVPPHGQRTLNFSEGDYFAWGASLKFDLYLRLWLVGRRFPLWLWVTGPS
jgi:hypothetical protein